MITKKEILQIGTRRGDNAIFNYYYNMISNRYDETTAQDTILKAVTRFKLKEYMDKSEKELTALFNSYIWTIAQTTYIDSIRTSNFKKNSFILYTTLFDSSSSEEEDYVTEKKQELMRIINNFPINDQEIILKRLEGFSFKEISKLLNIPESTARIKFKRSVAKIKSIKECTYKKGHISKIKNSYVAKVNNKYLGSFSTHDKAQKAIDMFYNIKNKSGF